MKGLELRVQPLSLEIRSIQYAVFIAWLEVIQ
jgi:hypothetical protein